MAAFTLKKTNQFPSPGFCPDLAQPGPSRTRPCLSLHERPGLFPWQIPLCQRLRRQRWHGDILLPAWHRHLSAELLGSAASLLSPAAQPDWLDVISDTEADIESDLRWSCVASGKPRPTVRWLRNGQPLTSQVPPASSDPAPAAPAPPPASLLHPSPGSHPASLLHVPPLGCEATARSPDSLSRRCHPSHCFVQLQGLTAGQQGGRAAPRACLGVTCMPLLRRLSKQSPAARGSDRTDVKTNPAFSPTENQAGLEESVAKVNPDPAEDRVPFFFFFVFLI